MSLIDKVTGEEIYSPHIRIYEPGSRDKFDYMNSTTFGDEGHSNLFSPEEIIRTPEIRDRHYCRVTAVVVEQSRFGYKKRVLENGQVLSETLLGYVNETTVGLILNKKR